MALGRYLVWLELLVALAFVRWAEDVAWFGLELKRLGQVLFGS